MLPCTAHVKEAFKEVEDMRKPLQGEKWNFRDKDGKLAPKLKMFLYICLVNLSAGWILLELQLGDFLKWCGLCILPQEESSHICPAILVYGLPFEFGIQDASPWTSYGIL